MEYIKGLIGILILADIILSFSLITPTSGLAGFCILGNQCNSVQNTQYGEFLGIKLGWLGFIAFSCLLIIYLITQRKRKYQKYFLASVSLGSLFALYFIYLQLFVLKKICATCMVIDSMMIAIAVISIYDFIKNKKGY